MQIVVDISDVGGRCRAIVMEALHCDANTLTGVRNSAEIKIPVSSVVGWSQIDEVRDELQLHRWLLQRPDIVCF